MNHENVKLKNRNIPLVATISVMIFLILWALMLVVSNVCNAKKKTGKTILL